MNSKGLTLIELLVSVAIVAVLSATAVGEYSHYKEIVYDKIAIRQNIDMRTSIEAAIEDVDFFTTTSAVTGCSATYKPNGDIEITNETAVGCDVLYKGFSHSKGAWIRVQIAGSNSGYTVHLLTAHCKGSQGKLGTSGSANDPYRAAFTQRFGLSGGSNPHSYEKLQEWHTGILINSCS